MERDSLVELVIDGRTVVMWILKKYFMKVWAEFILLRPGLVACFCEYGDGLLSYVKGGDLLT